MDEMVCILMQFLQTASRKPLPSVSGKHWSWQLNMYSCPFLSVFKRCFSFYWILDKPEISNSPRTIVNESEEVTLVRQVISNPFSNVSWYNGSDLLYTQRSVKTATFTIEKTTCTDTKNYTLFANNGVQENVTALVELIVNCEYDIFF